MQCVCVRVCVYLLFFIFLLFTLFIPNISGHIIRERNICCSFARTLLVHGQPARQRRSSCMPRRQRDLWLASENRLRERRDRGHAVVLRGPFARDDGAAGSRAVWSPARLLRTPAEDDQCWGRVDSRYCVRQRKLQRGGRGGWRELPAFVHTSADRCAWNSR